MNKVKKTPTNKLEIKNLSSIHALRGALLIIGTPPNYDFSWLSPITNSSLDENLILYLNNHVPVEDRFVTLDLEEHISEATALINSCNAKRTEILDLESQAYSKAIEYIEIINTIDDDRKLSELNLKSIFNLSNEIDILQYEKSLTSKYSAIDNILNVKFSLHNQIGNPLNYGERVTYLRKLYCDNVKKIYERLFAIKRTLKYSFEQDTNPLPNYIDISNKLDDLVWWMRESLYENEYKEQYDYLIQKSVSLSSYLWANSVDPRDYIRQNKDDALNSLKIELEVSDKDFGIDSNIEKSRILGVSVNILLDHDKLNEQDPEFYPVDIPSSNVLYSDPPKKMLMDNMNANRNNVRSKVNATKANNEITKEQILFYCEATPPAQVVRTIKSSTVFHKVINETRKKKEYSKKFENMKIVPDIVEIISQLEFDSKGIPVIQFSPTLTPRTSVSMPTKLVFGEIQPLYRTSINSNLKFSSENSIKNASPYGIWKFNFKNVTPTHLIYDGGNPTGLSLDFFKDVRDIVLTFRIAVRKF